MKKNSILELTTYCVYDRYGARLDVSEHNATETRYEFQIHICNPFDKSLTFYFAVRTWLLLNYLIEQFHRNVRSFIVACREMRRHCFQLSLRIPSFQGTTSMDGGLLFITKVEHYSISLFSDTTETR